jgi:glycosyltransferase involved in cell wall biosynthesis
MKRFRSNAMSKFSIVIPALNEEKYLPNLLTSLTKQSSSDFEVVVVDGSSKDNTAALARSFGARLPKLQVCVSAKAGTSLQRNLGARASDGEWLAFVDADSILLPYFIERLDCFIAERNPKLFTAWFRPDSEMPGDAVFALLTNLYVEGSIILHRPIAPGPLTVVRRDVFELVDGYNQAVTFGEDYDLTRRIAARGVAPQILRETLSVLSLRRMRKEGKFRSIRFYAQASLRVLLTRRHPDNAPSYITGGQFYETDHSM